MAHSRRVGQASSRSPTTTGARIEEYQCRKIADTKLAPLILFGIRNSRWGCAKTLDPPYPNPRSHMIPCNGPPRAASASTRRVTSGSSISGGAWCGLIRASITSEPRQPQCFSWVNESIPLMSAEGFDLVNVTHNQLLSVRAENSLSSTSTMSGNAAREFLRMVMAEQN